MLSFLLSGLRREPNPKYLYDYENDDMPVSRSRTRMQKEIRTSRESNDKENKKENSTNFRTNGRLRSMKVENHIEQNDADSNDDINEEVEEKPVEVKKEPVQEEPKVNGEHSKYYDMNISPFI